jgi:hypothetical protein
MRRFRRGLGRGREALGLGSSSFSGLPILLRTASRTLGRPLGLHALFQRRRFVPVISSQAIKRMASQRVIILVLVLKSGPPVEHGGGDDAPSQA